MKIFLFMAVLAVLFEAEYGAAWNFQKDIVPFPYAEFWLNTLNAFLRDVLLWGIVAFLYAKRHRLKDRTIRYFPVVVVGISYLLLAFFMVAYLELDRGFLTTFSVCTGLFDNIVIVLLAAMCYHHWPNKIMKAVYFLVYYLTCLILIFDGIYFWTTSMHVESVVFENLNIYAFKGFFATTPLWQKVALIAILVVYALLFRVKSNLTSKPNFTWSLVCVILFGLGFNLSYGLLSSAVYYGIDQVHGLDVEVDMEKSRKPTRDMIVMPVNLNFFHKAFFHTDKVMKNAKDFTPRVLTEQDLEALDALGIVPDPVYEKPGKASYDRVVLIVLESVHRDYINYYNKNIPEETTPFLNSLLTKYKKMNHYYSSAIPTTQGLNATFRSQLIYDGDLPGEKQGSIYRTAQEAGWKGIFLNASSRYYNKEFLEYPRQFGMETYLAREDLEADGYKGASGWGFHNDIMYDATLKILEEHKADKLLMTTKTLDMHQPYPYFGLSYDQMPDNVSNQGTVTVCGMYWVDQTLKHFFEEAEKEGLMDDRTLFIVTSDHNPHSGGEYKDLVEEEVDKQPISPIPLIFISKNMEPLEDLDEDAYASQEDLGPTLLRLMGLPTPEDFIGRDLLTSVDHPYALGYFGGKGYYYSDDLHFIATLNEAEPDTPAKDALANYIMHNYIKRHIVNLK
jgi:lipoteichoic acid synthase